MSSTTGNNSKTEAPPNGSEVNKEEPSIYRGVIGNASLSPSNLNKEATPTASNVAKETSSTEKKLKRRGPPTKNDLTINTSLIQNHKGRSGRSYTEKEVKVDQLLTGNDINTYSHHSKTVLKAEDPSFPTKVQHHSSLALKNERDLSRQLETAPASSNLKDVVAPKQNDSGGWSVSDTSHALQGEYALMFTDVRPSFVTIAGTRWQEGALLQFLLKLSKVECPVYLTPRDTLWKPSDDGRKTSRARIQALLAEDHKCELLFVWGALDLTTLQSLPKSVKNVGIALSDREDMQLVYELDRWGQQLEFIHFSFFKSFKTRHWGNRKFIPKSVSSGYTCLHFPDLHVDDLEWMKSIISVVVPRDDQKSCVWGLYFPGTSLSSNALMSVVMSTGLQCKVFLPAPRAPDDRERKKAMKKYKRHKCSIQWILEAI